MNFFNRAFENLITAREEQANRFINEYAADNGLSIDLSTDPRG
nr:hypothetical protein [uncultured Cohaesibacter sp.]